MRWGFIGTGRIARRIMEAFRLLPDSHVTAAYSRNHAELNRFCDDWNVPNRHGSVEELARDPQVDILYLATPHIVHLEHFRRAVTAGKAILCEKPMAMSSAETLEMVRAAREHRIFLMEGLWTRFFPVYDYLDKLIGSGALGDIYNVMADFSYHSPYDPSLRFFRKDLGGGAMRGAGIYPLALAAKLYQSMPCEIKVIADMKNGVDLRSSALLRFPGGGMAQILSGFQGQSVQGANIAFEKGSVWIPDFWNPRTLVVRYADKQEIIERPFEFPGFQFEILETERCVRRGLLESPHMTWRESVGLAGTLDQMIRQMQQPDTQTRSPGGPTGRYTDEKTGEMMV